MGTKENSIPLFKSGLAVLLPVMVLFSLMVITKHHYERLTADATLYVSIAEKYVNGDYANAINGYWGPLLAWLLIPFLYLGTSPVFAVNALNLIFGNLIIFGVWKLSFSFDISGRIRKAVLISLLPITLYFSLVQPMDTLLVCILIYYLLIVFDRDYPDRTAQGVMSGALGALAYFTKAYALPFFIAHFFAMNIFHYLRVPSTEKKRKIIYNALVGFSLFFLISGAWIMAISNKYGHMTFSTMRDTNFNAPGPEAMGGGLEFGVPVFSEGFFEPPNDSAFVVWEDPSYLRGTPWSPWHSWPYFKHFIKLTLKNILEGLRIYESFSTFSITILLAYLLFMLQGPAKEILSRRDLLYPFFTVILYSGGYVLFHFEARYLWIVNLLLLLMGGYVLTILFQKEFFHSSLRRGILIAFFIISFIFTPSRHILQASGGSMDKDMYYLSRELTHYGIHGNIASNREFVPTQEAWHKTFRLAYWLKGRYYGQRGEATSDKDLEIELKKYNIDYYFFWGEPARTPQFLTEYREITGGVIPGLNIYSLKERKEFKK